VAGWRNEKERKREGRRERECGSRRRPCGVGVGGGYNCSALCHQGRYQSRKDRRAGPAVPRSNLLGTQQSRPDAIELSLSFSMYSTSRRFVRYITARAQDGRASGDRTAGVGTAGVRPAQSNPRWGATDVPRDWDANPRLHNEDALARDSSRLSTHLA